MTARVKNASSCFDDLVILAAASTLTTDTTTHKRKKVVLQGVVRFPQLTGVDLMARGAGGLTSLFDFNPFRAAFIDGDALLDIVLPRGVADDFRDLEIPTILITTDFYQRSEFVIDSGPLRPAIAASIALPALILPRIEGDQVLVDGGLVNPLPVDHLQGKADISVAVDVTGNTTAPGSGAPSTIEAMYGAVQIMQHVITKARLKEYPVDVLIKPDVARFRVLDFFKVREVLRASEPVKDELKSKLEAAFAAAQR